MATINIEDLNTLSAPATGDLLLVTDISATSDKEKKLALSAVALTGRANSFTKSQTVAPDTTNVNGLVINMPTSNTARALQIQYNSNTMIELTARADNVGIAARAFDNGSGAGATVAAERNRNDSTPAPGGLLSMSATGNYQSIYVDNSGVWRTVAGAPTNATFASGTIVGSQSSSVETKDILGPGVAPGEALRTLLETPVHRFVYKDGRYRDSEFHGIVAEDSPQFAMDAGTVFNPVSAFGYTVQAIKALHERIAALEARLGEAG